jgi:hypothetical protein
VSSRTARATQRNRETLSPKKKKKKKKKKEIKEKEKKEGRKEERKYHESTVSPLLERY